MAEQAPDPGMVEAQVAAEAEDDEDLEEDDEEFEDGEEDNDNTSYWEIDFERPYTSESEENDFQARLMAFLQDEKCTNINLDSADSDEP